MCRAVLIALLIVLCGQATADKAMTAAGVTVKVQGQSGKMTMTVPTATSGTTMDIQVRMEGLRQLDANNIALGGGGSEKHSFNSFATQSFTFSEPMEAKYEGLNVTKVTFESTLVASSKLKIETMIFRQEGEFSVGSDTLKVAPGTIKFNVELGTWSWCGGDVACKSPSGDGDSVELDISVGAVGGGSPSKSDSKTLDLGGGSKLLMLNTYSTDGGKSWLTMPEGYPKSSGTTFTLRFPKWDGTVVYDPLVTGGSRPVNAATVAGARMPALLAAIFWAAM